MPRSATVRKKVRRKAERELTHAEAVRLLAGFLEDRGWEVEKAANPKVSRKPCTRRGDAA